LAKVPTRFMGVFGIGSVELASSSSATHGMPVFVDFYLMLDNSPSMGVAATPADITTMVNNTPDKCAFACHEESNSNNYYKLAKKLGVQMRIDVLRTATQQLMDTATATATLKNQFRMAIYTFNMDMQLIAPLTSNLSSAKNQANKIDLMKVPYQNWNNDQLTDYEKVMPAINTAIPAPGDGLSSVKPQKFLFFVSDGVGDAYNPGSCLQPTMSSGRCHSQINLARCQAIKDRGIKIAVLYTTYLPLPTNDHYNKWIAPWTKSISPTMEKCASPGLFFEVSPSQGISEAMNALFQKAVAQARLTK
jgi:hypothetical protein